MLKCQKAYLLKNRGLVVTDKSFVKNTQDSDFEEVLIAISEDEIKEWAKEIDVVRLDENEWEDDE